MRLLNVFTLEFAVFHAGDTPPYVIASHRWSAGAEATFKDVLKRRSTHKTGYKKILEFADYMRINVPTCQWLWIDTCCIDDRSSQEVSEAINSMFRWYSNAVLCLAYLVDVHTVDVDRLSESEWFTRGWTLQELLASPTVIFLTKDWKVIGHKGAEKCHLSSLDFGQSLVEIISSRTAIPGDVLQDYRRSKRFSVRKRLEWTADRKTTREEDMSYCLFGIFDVAIGANYGEGAERARKRLLKEISASGEVVDISEGRALTTSIVPLQSEDNRLRHMHHRVMSSLNFIKMEDRRSQIDAVYQGTYDWAVISPASDDSRWDSLPAWLSSERPRSSIYWINAKPVAGKSTLIRFLDNKIDSRDMYPWAMSGKVLSFHYYFWNAGTALQKTLTGFLRTILHQLFSQTPDLLMSCVPDNQDMMAQHSDSSAVSWTDAELWDCLRQFLSQVAPSTRIFGLVDGLDEIDGADDARDKLVNILRDLTGDNVKICVSSRRYTIFQDAFATCPQLRLDDFNTSDIAFYVDWKFRSQYRYGQMLIYSPEIRNLVGEVVNRAQGVFLWARLVVEQLVRGIRDGDSYQALRQTLWKIPADMNEYFRQIIASIEPQHLEETSRLLQIMLYDERQFIAVHPIRLMDLLFLADAHHDFALSDRETNISLLKEPRAMIHRLESTLRKLFSHCPGLLECHFEVHDHGESVSDGESLRDEVLTGSITTLPEALVSRLITQPWLAFALRIEFMHRSLRDFLLEPESQRLLHEHTGGRVDVRGYLRNARLTQIHMLMHSNTSPQLATGLGSYVICSLYVADFRDDVRQIPFVERLGQAVNFLKRDLWMGSPYWYIARPLKSWDSEQSNIMTLAIDFGLIGYLTHSLTTGSVWGKSGRPLLDYALRPRFATDMTDMRVGNYYPLPNLVRRILALGADPNEKIDGVSLWPLFLSFVADLCANLSRQTIIAASCIETLEVMIRAGASSTFPMSAISMPTSHGCYPHSYLRTHAMAGQFDAATVFSMRWPLLVGATQTKIELDQKIAISDILENLSPILGDGIDGPKEAAHQHGLAHSEPLSRWARVPLNEVDDEPFLK